MMWRKQKVNEPCNTILLIVSIGAVDTTNNHPDNLTRWFNDDLMEKIWRECVFWHFFFFFSCHCKSYYPFFVCCSIMPHSSIRCMDVETGKCSETHSHCARAIHRCISLSKNIKGHYSKRPSIEQECCKRSWTVSILSKAVFWLFAWQLRSQRCYSRITIEPNG